MLAPQESGVKVDFWGRVLDVPAESFLSISTLQMEVAAQTTCATPSSFRFLGLSGKQINNDEELWKAVDDGDSPIQAIFFVPEPQDLDAKRQAAGKDNSKTSLSGTSPQTFCFESDEEMRGSITEGGAKETNFGQEHVGPRAKELDNPWHISDGLLPSPWADMVMGDVAVVDGDGSDEHSDGELEDNDADWLWIYTTPPGPPGYKFSFDRLDKLLGIASDQ